MAIVGYERNPGDPLTRRRRGACDRRLRNTGRNQACSTEQSRPLITDNPERPDYLLNRSSRTRRSRISPKISHTAMFFLVHLGAPRA
jgi:hypothetical protein